MFFYYDLHIKRFLDLSDEFVNTQNDTENANLESFQDYEHNKDGKTEIKS